jgi:hypothetical protein
MIECHFLSPRQTVRAAPGHGRIAARMCVETLTTIKKATMIHEELRSARLPRDLTDERG